MSRNSAPLSSNPTLGARRSQPIADSRHLNAPTHRHPACLSLRMRPAILLSPPPLLPAQQNSQFPGRYWIPHMNTRIRVESAGLGSDIDARTDLGIRDANFPEAAFTWQHGRSLVTFS